MSGSPVAAAGVGFDVDADAGGIEVARGLFDDASGVDARARERYPVGVDLARAQFVRDAELTLQSILDEDGRISERRFHDVVGGLLREAGRRSRQRRVRAFGEMVDLLVDRGGQVAADVLERYWNDLAAQLNFMLLCGYGIDLFDTDVQAALLPQIHRSHSHVLPGAHEEQFPTAVERALLEVLGKSDARKVCAQVSAGNAKAPASQLALMWMSAHMPRAATKVLAVARSYYGEEAAA